MVKQVSIIITTKNGYEWTWHLLDSIYRTTDRSRVELIIVDNGSTDQTSCLSEYVDAYLTNEKAANLAASINIGIKKSTTDIVYIINNDVILLTNNWMDTVLKAFKSNGASVYMPLMIEGRHHSAGIKIILEAIDRRGIEQNPALEKGFTHLEMACTFFHKEIFKKIGYFDERLPLWYHHQDYLVRLLINSVPIYRIQNIATRHYGSATIDRSAHPLIEDCLRQEYALFKEIYSRSPLDHLGLKIPDFGPFDLNGKEGNVIMSDYLNTEKTAEILLKIGA